MGNVERLIAVHIFCSAAPGFSCDIGNCRSHSLLALWTGAALFQCSFVARWKALFVHHFSSTPVAVAFACCCANDCALLMLILRIDNVHTRISSTTIERQRTRDLPSRVSRQRARGPKIYRRVSFRSRPCNGLGYRTTVTAGY